MRISIIVAMDENGGIGFESHLPWRLSTDMKRFKQLTMGHHLVVGRKTFESIGRLLPGRRMIVMTRSREFHYAGVDIVDSLEAAIALSEKRDEDELFIGGGSEIYRLALPFTDRIYLTWVHAQIKADVHFPKFDISSWNEISRAEFEADKFNQYPTAFSILEKGA
ncbi:MAG: dihydrofolate reductase [Anaerolineales bacterium]|nr:dihydrofolate reductase [Chloroflexota bacterium]MBL6982895.1 dihydrofolate reductase [Anaerolineales bacterium]